jgi:beta-xylosidase
MRSLRTALTLLVLLLGALTASAGAAPVRDAALDVDSCGIDEFDGGALDSARWTVLRPNASGMTVSGGQLRLQALQGDLFGDRDTAQNVVLQNAPSGAWTATTQFDTTALTVEGQQSGLVVRKSATTFSKFVFINKGSGATRFEHIFTDDQRARLADEDFTTTLPAGFPKTVKVRVISDGESIRGEYADGNTWKPIGRPAKIGSGVQVGVYAADNAADGPVVPYDSFAVNAQSDEFAGDTLEKCRWSQIVRESATGYRVANGALEIDTGSDEVDGTAPNLIGQPVPAGSWQAETKVDLTTTQQGQQAGLLLYKENENWAKVVLVRTGAGTAQIEFVRVRNDAYQLDQPFNVSVPTTTTSFHLRLRSNGSRATAVWSADGTTWAQVGRQRDISDLTGAHLGPMALRGGAANPVTAKFDYVRVSPSPVAACTPSGTVESGFSRLWNGVDFANTTQAGPGGFDLVNDGAEGCRLQSKGGLGLLWFNAKTYDNFVLRLQWKATKATDNSGVFVRFPNPGTNQQLPIDQGHEIQIREGVAGDGEDQKTGSIYGIDRENARAAKPAGEWNDYEIKFADNTYTITLNGTVVNTYTNTSTKGTSAGYIGLQNHGTGDDVSFRNLRIQELAAATNIFTTIGITRANTRANGQIRGGWTFIGEEMPPSGTVGVAPNDAQDDVPVRMPDTTGNVANLAEYRGQTLTLDPADQKNYAKLHLFGTTADGTGTGTYTFKYDTGPDTTATVTFPDWCGSVSPPAHIAIGPGTGRYTPAGQDGARCSIYHVAVDNPAPTRKLVAVQLPPNTSPGGNARSYLMALTLEDAQGNFELPNLTGINPFPNDDSAPQTAATVGGEPEENGWYTTTPRITIEGSDPGQDQSGVEQIQYRINGGTPQLYSGPFDLDAEGEVRLEFRAVDRAGNAETFHGIDLKVDPNAPTTTATTYPHSVLVGGWYDREVTVSLRASDGEGSGTEVTEYRVNDDEAWQPYDGPFQVAAEGENVVEYRSRDVAGNVEAGHELTLLVDVTAPVTTIQINGADPLAEYSGPVRIAFLRADDPGIGAVATQYRVGDGEWTAYTGAFDLTAYAGYRVDFRSIDVAGNVERFRTVTFAIRRPVTSATPQVQPQATPAPAPRPFAALQRITTRVRTVSALRGGRFKFNVSCQAVERGTVRLTVTRSVARKLKLKSGTLARKVLRCGDEGRATVSLRPSATVRKALARSKQKSVRAKLTLRMTGAAADTQVVTFRGKS